MLRNRKYETDFLLNEAISFPDITACQHTTESFELINCTLPNGGNCLGPQYWTDTSHTLPESGNMSRTCITAHFYGIVVITKDKLLAGAKLKLVFNITSLSTERSWTGLNVFFHSEDDAPYITNDYLDRYALQAGITLLATLQQVTVDERITFEAKTQSVYNIDRNEAENSGTAIVDVRFSTLIETDYNLKPASVQFWELASPWAGVIGLFPTISIIVMIVLASIARPCCVCHLYEDDGSSCGFSGLRPERL